MNINALKVRRWLLTGVSLIVMLAQIVSPTPVSADHTRSLAAAPIGLDWCVAGSFQGWNNTSDQANDEGLGGDLIANDGIFSLNYTVATAGRHEFKFVECGNWSVSYPSQNSWFYTSSANQPVTFSFDTNDHGGDAGWNAQPAIDIVHATDDGASSYTAVGDWQGWNNANPATLMTDVGNGIYRLAYIVAAAGSYQAKIVRTGSWAEQYVVDGRAVDGTPLGFTTNAANEEVVFLLDTRASRVTIASNGSGVGNWCLAGGFQSWNNASTPLNDDGINGDLLGGDGVFSIDYIVPNAGREEFKSVECGNWSVAFPSDNAWILTSAPNQTVKFTFDTNDHSGDAGPNYIPAQNIVNAQDDLPGSFTIVGPWQGWNNASAATTMTPLGSNQFFLEYPFAAPGLYEAKISQTGNWDNQFGADGRHKNAPTVGFEVFNANDTARFLLNGDIGRWAIITPPLSGGAGHDNNIFWDDLGHDSRDTLYRTPGGPVTTSTPVTLRMRAASGDLTAAKVRVWNDLINAQYLINMSLVADDGTYEWWEATLPVSTESTIYWYRFIAIDGTATAYYEDNSSRDGGWGQTFGTSPDNGWQLTMYDPAFLTPDFVKNGVIYQIFPDRFRDGDTSNDPQPGRFFYGELNGTVYRSDPDGGTTNAWNTPVCDPRDNNDCPGTYSRNFYGGDLQGVIDQLDYLDDLGVTILYFNPIFESPSNHKYDTTDYGVISRDFGDLATFEALVSAANSRGMSIVLDGVFNHTSSDSIYFDRYSRFDAAGNETSPGPGVNDGSGACESQNSPYRGWYYFTDVSAGTGPCVGSDGTPSGATYESWFGFDSLPKLRAGSQGVRDLIFDDGPQSVALYWLAEGADGWRFDVGGDVDPGRTNDPNNDYWESFRTTARALNPDAYMVLEEWGNASAWTLGGEMDATMNYQYSSAMLSFWRDTTFTDNDHNTGSSTGALTPLSPSQLDARLHNWVERYPPEAMYAMMNLLGSHDTSRALFMLDESAANGTDASPLLNPNYNWSDALTRLKGVALLQMTLPGAPTIYYGDEVGLVGPTYYYGGKWEDDPYNRQPYPWLDESGTPFYTHLQAGGAGHTDLLPYYQTLTAARNSHSALRTGSFDTLLVDDSAKVYAYGRLMDDYSDAAVVIVNRNGAAQSVTINVSGYLPVGAPFTDVLNGGSYVVNASGEITVPSIPGMNGAVLVSGGAMSVPPAAVSDLLVKTVSSNSANLSWGAIAGATSYDVYRSLVSGGGYTLVANTNGTTFSDTGLQVATDYFYVVVSKNNVTLLTSGNSNEAQATAAYTIGWANLQWPPSINHTISAIDRTDTIYGQIWIDGVTSTSGATPGLLAQVGFGPSGSTPDDNWTWEAMSFNTDTGNNDEYMGSLLPDMLGTYCYTTRYSGNGGNSWFYAVNGPPEGNPICPGPFGVLTVNPGADTTAPVVPASLAIDGTTSSSISLVWDAHPNTDGDLYGFELYRENMNAPGYTRIATIPDIAATNYVDTNVTTGETYNYYLLAFDESYNRSDASNIVQAAAEPRQVSVTFRIGVPGYTPGTVYIVGDIPEFGPWNPGLVPMTKVNATTWEYTLDLLDGLSLQYKFTRGSWDMVESWGSIVTINNRSVNIDYGTDGTQLVDMTATDWGTGADSTKAVQYWRDPLVVSHTPVDSATAVALNSAISVVWSIPMNPATNFVVTGPGGVIAGSFVYDSGSQTVTFTPDANLQAGTTYNVAISGAISTGVPDGDSGVLQVPVNFSFMTVSIVQMIEGLRADVQALKDAGTLNNGQTNSLVTKLTGAITKLNNGQPQVAVGHLNAFIDGVNTFVTDGVLTVEEGQALIDTAQMIINAINAS